MAFQCIQPISIIRIYITTAFSYTLGGVCEIGWNELSRNPEDSERQVDRILQDRLQGLEEPRADSAGPTFPVGGGQEAVSPNGGRPSGA